MLFTETMLAVNLTCNSGWHLSSSLKKGMAVACGCGSLMSCGTRLRGMRVLWVQRKRLMCAVCECSSIFTSYEATIGFQVLEVSQRLPFTCSAMLNLLEKTVS